MRMIPEELNRLDDVLSMMVGGDTGLSSSNVETEIHLRDASVIISRLGRLEDSIQIAKKYGFWNSKSKWADSKRKRAFRSYLKGRFKGALYIIEKVSLRIEEIIKPLIETEILYIRNIMYHYRSAGIISHIANYHISQSFKCFWKRDLISADRHREAAQRSMKDQITDSNILTKELQMIVRIAKYIGIDTEVYESLINSKTNIQLDNRSQDANNITTINLAINEISNSIDQGIMNLNTNSIELIEYESDIDLKSIFSMSLIPEYQTHIEVTLHGDDPELPGFWNIHSAGKKLTEMDYEFTYTKWLLDMVPICGVLPQGATNMYLLAVELYLNLDVSNAIFLLDGLQDELQPILIMHRRRLINKSKHRVDLSIIRDSKKPDNLAVSRFKIMIDDIIDSIFGPQNFLLRIANRKLKKRDINIRKEGLRKVNVVHRLFFNQQ